MNAAKDNNNVNTLIAVLNTSGKSIGRVYADPSTHRLKINDGTTGSDFGPANAMKDDNDVSTLLGVSKNDNSTVITSYVDASGQLLIQST